MRGVKLSLLLICCAMYQLPGEAWAHSGGLDSKGCHTNRKTGDYHCHRVQAPEARPDKSAAAAPLVKKSSSGICHDSSSPYYGRTTNFTAYKTIEECLDSGGRRPK